MKRPEHTTAERERGMTASAWCWRESSSFGPRGRPSSRLGRMGLALLATVCLAAATARAGTVPCTESFESYALGYVITNADGWSGSAWSGVVTNPAAVLQSLADYTNGTGYAYPLPGATHTQVLATADAVTNSVASATGGVAIVDLLVMPAQRATPPADNTNRQFACYVYTNGQLVVWRRDTVAGTNAWLLLTGSPILPTGQWARITLSLGYAQKRYQVAINGGSPISDMQGWDTAGGSGHPGPWFDMVQTNGYCSRIGLEGTATAYLDDLVATRRVLTFGATTFTETNANNGAIGNAVTVGLAGDTFTDVSPLVSGVHYTNSAVPPGLTCTVTRASATNLTVAFTGAAVSHAAADSTNVMLRFLDAAFALGKADDVQGSSNTVSIVFSNNAGVLTYSTNVFHEAPANDGTVMGGTIALDAAMFNGLAGQDFVAAGKVLTNNVPAGLGVTMTMNATSNQLTVAFEGSAASHTNGNSVTNLVFTFTDDAFAGGAASSISGYDRTDLQVVFRDQPLLNYAPAGFQESVTNNGGIANTVQATLAGTTFRTSLGAGDCMAGGVPAGLSLAVTRLDGTNAVLALTGLAQNHTAADSTNVVFAFKDSAFDTVLATNIVGVSATLGVAFSNQPWLVWSDTNYHEATTNDGTIVTTNTLELNGGETFTGEIGDNFSNRVTVDGVPSGLTCVVTRVSNATTLQVVLSGTAQDHSGRDVTLSFELSDSAFTVVPATNITGSASELTLHFIDPRGLTTNSVPYQESFEGYPDGFELAATNGWLANAGGAVVTTNPAVVAALAAAGAGSGFPLDTTHAKVLQLNGVGDATIEIRSSPGGTVTIECMFFADPVDYFPMPGTNQQIGFCVDTNQRLNVWRRNKDTSACEWAALTDGGFTVSTGEWHRVRLTSDYDQGVYSIAVDGTTMIDSGGMATAGGPSPGRWFYMAQTNGYLSRLRLHRERAASTGYVDDLSVKLLPSGTIYRFR